MQNNSKNISLREYISENLNINQDKILFFDHHLSHAISSYYFSPYFEKESLVLTIDGHGDGYWSKLYHFTNQDTYRYVDGSKIELELSNFYVSIGILYGNFTEAMGLRRDSDEGKVEALAAYGTPNKQLFLQLQESYFIENLSIHFVKDKIESFFDIDWLKSKKEEIGEKNFCATIQKFLEHVAIDYLQLVSNHFPHIQNLCLSGGVVANIILTLNIYEKTNFKNLFIVPFMGDDGCSVGGAILGAKKYNQNVNWLNKISMPYLGDQITQNDIEEAIKFYNHKINFKKLENDWMENAAISVANNKIIAVVQGRMEFGPRALGNRSIFANVMYKDTQERLNKTVKRRPWYQPFCPLILEDERERLFENSYHHKHMATAFRMKDEYCGILPSAVHIDKTARPEFLVKEDNEKLYLYLLKLKELTGYGICINTSFNLHGRTIVRTAFDAILDFIDCNIDELYLGQYLITRKD